MMMIMIKIMMIIIIIIIITVTAIMIIITIIMMNIMLNIPFQWQLLNTLTHFFIDSMSALTVTIAKSRLIPVNVNEGKYISTTGQI